MISLSRTLAYLIDSLISLTANIDTMNAVAIKVPILPLHVYIPNYVHFFENGLKSNMVLTPQK